VSRIQGVLAVAIPWIVAVVMAPGSWIWVLLSLIVPLLFASLHWRQWLAWLAPVSGLVSVVPGVPPWASAIVAVAASVVLVLRPPVATHDTQAPAYLTASGTRWSICGVLLIAAVALASYGLVQIREQDASFKAGQETAAQMWVVDPESVPDPEVDTPIPDDPSAPDGGVLVGQPLEVQEAAAAPVKPPFAKLRFVRKGTDAPIVTDRALYVGPDVTDRGLAAGPGHYPGTARPGKKGNIAIAGHRTGWGSPFLHLDDLQPGDRIKLTDRTGVRHTYVVDSSTLVSPSADWVLGDDPLGTGEPTLTLTTCDPPRVNTERLIVFATLKTSASDILTQ